MNLSASVPLPPGVLRVTEVLAALGHPHTPVMLDDAARTAAVDPVLTPDLLAELVDQGDWQAVFVLFPPRVESLMNISDAGGRLPYRTVEFEQPLPWMPY